MIVLVEGVKSSTELQPLLVRLVESGELFGSTFWATIVGAVVGGLIGIVGQILTTRHNERMMREQRREINKAVGRSALMKLLRLQASAKGVSNHIGHSLAEAKKANMAAWAATKPLASMGEPIHFSPEEMALVSSFNNSKLTDTFMTLDHLHNSFIPLWNIYSETRQRLLSKLTPEHFQRNMGKITLTNEEALPLLPYMAELDDLIGQMHSLSNEVVESSMETLKLLISELNKKYDLQMEFQTI